MASVWPYNTARWRRLRLAKLMEAPLCEPCLRCGRHTPANTVDHNKAVKAGGNPFPPLDELTSCCPKCHGTKTSHLDRPDRRAGSGILRGCDADGLPIDPQHPWRSEG